VPYLFSSDVKISVSVFPLFTEAVISWRTAIADVELLTATEMSSHDGHFTRVSRCAIRESMLEVLGALINAALITSTQAASQVQKDVINFIRALDSQLHLVAWWKPAQ